MSWGVRSVKVIAAAGLGLLIVSSANSVSTRPHFASFIEKKDIEYRGAGPLRTKLEVWEKRRALQAAIFEEFFKNPEAFIRRIPKKNRHFLFDAIVDGQAMMRVGRPADGGKWVCNPQSLGDQAVVYSFGVGDDISFDTDMAGLFGCHVHLFDPDPAIVRSFPSPDSGYSCGRGRLYYHPIGLGPVSSEKGKEWNLLINGRACVARSLLDIARTMHHAHVDVLKIDIEGGEFAALREILSSGALATLDVKMLLVEFHIWNTGLFGDFVRLLADLNKENYWLFRKEFNPASIMCAEYAFVNSSFLGEGSGPAPSQAKRP